MTRERYIELTQHLPDRGDDWDRVLVDWMLTSIEEEHGIELSRDLRTRQRLEEAAEEARRELMSAPETSVSVPVQTTAGLLHFERTLTRERFIELTSAELGDDWVQLLADWMAAIVEAEHGVALNDRLATQRLKEAAEQAKVELSSVSETSINLPFLTVTDAGPVHFERTLTREMFIELTQRRPESCVGPFRRPFRDGCGNVGEIGLSSLLEGLEALRLGKLERAEASLRKSASVDWDVKQPMVTVAVAPGVEARMPASTEAAVHALVEVLQRQGRQDAALALLEAMEPSELVAVSAAELLLELERPGEVLAAFADLRAVDTPAEQCLNVLVAVAAERAGDVSGADQRLRAVLAVQGLEDDLAVEALAVRAALADRAGRRDVAQACRRKLTRLDPDHPALSATGAALTLSTEGLAELRQRVDELTDLVVERETELADRRSRLEAFVRRFMSRVGRLMAEVDELQARLAAAQAAAAPDDPMAREAAESARVQADESAEAYGDAVADEADDGVDDTPEPASDELASLWRKAARMMHPDATMDEAEKRARHEYFARLEAAYRNRDIDEVRSIMEEWSNRPELVEGDSVTATAERLRRTAAQLERQLRELGIRLDELTADPMWALMLRVEEAAEQGRDLLAEMSDTLRAQRDELADDLLTLEAL